MARWIFLRGYWLVAMALYDNANRNNRQSLTWGQIRAYGHALQDYLKNKDPNNLVVLQLGQEEIEELLYDYPDIFITLDDRIGLKNGATADTLLKRILRYISDAELFIAMHDESNLSKIYE